MPGFAAPSSCSPKARIPEEFLEHTKLELFHDQVFCFTPKGKLIALPRKATPIDFAYAVHTDVGNRAVGCKINGQMAPLVSELNNGDEVDILTSKAQDGAASAWESIVVTGRARLAIRRATRNAVRAQYAALGRRIVERLIQRAKREYSDEKLTGALPRLARPRSTTCLPPSAAARCGPPTSAAPCIPTTRRSASPRCRRRSRRPAGSVCARARR
jgi:(p)ppGpp synthase/HD superfamily hydrolase